MLTAKRYSVILVIPLVFFVGALALGIFFFRYSQPVTTYYTLDGLMHESCQSTLKDFCTAHATLSCHSLMQEIIKNFGYVQRVSLKKRSFSLYEYKFQSYEPLMRVSPHNIILENGNLVDESCIDRSVLLQLPSIETPCGYSEKDRELLCQWFKECGYELLSVYRVQWFNQAYIKIYDKEHSSLVCIAHTKRLVTEKIIKQALALLLSAIQNQKDKKSCLVADLRFDDQVVIRKYRGNNEGEII